MPKLPESIGQPDSFHRESHALPALRSSAGPQAEDPTAGTVNEVCGARQLRVGHPWNNNEPRQARGRQQGVPSVLDPGRIPLPSRPWQPTALNRTCLAGSRMAILWSAAGSMSGSVLQEGLDDGDDQAVMGDTAIVAMRHVRALFNSSGSARVGNPCSTHARHGAARLSSSLLFKGRHFGALVLQQQRCPAWRRRASGCGERHRLPRCPLPWSGPRQPRRGRTTSITARNDLALRMAPCPMQRVGYRRA